MIKIFNEIKDSKPIALILYCVYLQSIACKNSKLINKELEINIYTLLYIK